VAGINLEGREKFYDIVAIKKGAAPQTLLAAVAGNDPTTTPNINISQPDPTVKNLYSFSSPKTDTAPIGAEDEWADEAGNIAPITYEAVFAHTARLHRICRAQCCRQRRLRFTSAKSLLLRLSAGKRLVINFKPYTKRTDAMHQFFFCMPAAIMCICFRYSRGEKP